jgi:polyether ionophore transport system permease protein
VSSETLAVKVRRYRSPRTAIGRFTIQRTFKSAAFLALVFGVFVATKASGFVQAFPSEAARKALLAQFGNSTGIVALVGRPVNLTSVGAYAAWNTLISMVMIGGIWGLLAATKTLRGEEENGRWELLLSGQTTARRALVNVMWGLGFALLITFIFSSVIFAAVGHMHKVDFSTSSGIIFAGTITLGTAAFMSLGVLTSQLMPTRSRASTVAAAIFGLAFIIRALADVANISWLLALSPLGWIEQVHPLATNHVVWLWPVVGWIVVMIVASLYLAGRRDLGASTFADNDTARPRYALLNHSITTAFRLTRMNTLGWVASVLFGSIFFSELTKTAAKAFSDAAKAQKFLGHLTHATQTMGGLEFLGIVFLILMILMMCFAASAVHAIRLDEAQGYLDNMLVRPVSRLGWLTGRIALVVVTTLSVAFVAGVVIHLGLTNQSLGISWHDVLLAGVNMFAPTLFITGLGILFFGILPRWTSLVMYSLVAWSFLVQMISSGLNLSHWILDTSLFQHVALAPASPVRWSSWYALVGLSFVMMAVGVMAFIRRDIVTE